MSRLFRCFSVIWSKCSRIPLREKCPDVKFVLVRIFPYLDWIRTGKNSAFRYFSRRILDRGALQYVHQNTGWIAESREEMDENHFHQVYDSNLHGLIKSIKITIYNVYSVQYNNVLLQKTNKVLTNGYFPYSCNNAQEESRILFISRKIVGQSMQICFYTLLSNWYRELRFRTKYLIKVKESSTIR